MIIRNSKIDKSILKKLVVDTFQDMVKYVVDIDRKIIAIGSTLHADDESILLADGSQQEHLWGANFYPYNKPEQRIEYTSLINIRPGDENYSMEIQSKKIREQIKKISEQLILGSDEQIS